MSAHGRRPGHPPARQATPPSPPSPVSAARGWRLPCAPSACPRSRSACASASSGAGSMPAAPRPSIRCPTSPRTCAPRSPGPTPWPGRKSPPSRSPPTARANGCCACQARPRGARARNRDRLHPRVRPRHPVHLEPGRLHAHLHLLPHRHPAAGAQPRARGDRRPDPAGARPHRRLAGRHRSRRMAA